MTYALESREFQRFTELSIASESDPHYAARVEMRQAAGRLTTEHFSAVFAAFLSVTDLSVIAPFG